MYIIYNFFQKYEASSWILYEKMIDQIPFDEIMKSKTCATLIRYFHKTQQVFLFSELNLPDTFNSWFLITELHLWMVCVRLMNEGTKGSMIRNYLVEALWNDVEFRAKKLGPVSFQR